MAERGGFEPPEPVSQFNNLANCRLQPLGHLSAARCAFWGETPPGATLSGPLNLDAGRAAVKGFESEKRLHK